MQNGDKEKPGTSPESTEALRKKNADFDFGWLVRGYLRKEGFKDRKSTDSLIAALNADPSGKTLLDAKPAGEKWAFSGFAKSHFEGPLGGLSDVVSGTGTARETLVAEILKKKQAIVAEELADAARRTSVRKLLKSEYELTAAETRKLDEAVAKAAAKDVAKALRDTGKREDFLWTCLGRPNGMPPKSPRVERVKKLSSDPQPGSPETPQERAKRIAVWQKAILSGRLTDEQAAEIVEEFRSPEDRKILVRALVPNSNLGTLVEKGFVTEKEARAAVRKATLELVAENPDGKAALKNLRDEDIEAVVANANLKDVPVAVDDLPDAVLEGFVSDVALTGRLAAKLQEECNRSVEDLVETIDGKFRVEADEEGIVAKNFVRESVRRLVPERDPKTGRTGPGISDFSPLLSDDHLRANGSPAYVDGDCRMENGEIHRVIMKVGPWNEFSGGGKTVSVTLYENDYETEIGTSEVGYADFHRLLANFNNGSAYGRTQFETSRRKRRIDAGTAAPEELLFDTLADLQKYVDAADSEGEGVKIAKGMVFRSGKPSDGADYNVAMVTAVDEGARTVTFVSSNGNSSTVAFETFAAFFGFGLEKSGEGDRPAGKVSVHRVAGSAATVADVLNLQKNGSNKASYKDFVFESTGDLRRIVASGKRYETGNHGVTAFVNGRNEGVEIGGINADGTVRIRLIRDFEAPREENGKKIGAKAKAGGDFVTKPALTLHYLIESMGLEPYDAPIVKPDETIPDTPFQTHGFLKSLMHNPSINDFLKGMSRIPDVIKHRLEHSHKHHSAHMAHSIASTLSKWKLFPEEWLVDFERELYSEDKKMLDEDIDHLGGINPPSKRQRQVEKFLLDSATTPTEAIACVCVMLEKHGNLYAGVMKKYEGRWLYFSRLPGSKEDKEAFIASQKKKYVGRHINEEFAIHEYLKVKAPELHLNPAYWKMVKDRWDKGADSEKGNGQKEVQNRPTFEGRASYVMEKFGDQEYANGIGAMEEVWNKSGPLHARMEAPFILAFTNVRENIHVSLLQKFVSQFDAGHTYPPLLFIQDSNKQKLFRRVVRKCAESVGPTCVQAFDEQLAPLFSGGNNNALIDGAKGFWRKYGEALSPKLTMATDDPFVILNKETDTDLAEYYETVADELGNSKLNDVEADVGLYGSSSGRVNWAMMNPKRYSGMIEFQSGPGNLKPGALTEFLFKELLGTLETVRDTKYDADPEKDLEAKKTLYRRLHQNFQSIIIRDVSSDWWNPDSNGRMRMYTHNWMQRLMRYGFTAPASKAQDNLEGETYERWLEGDFARFLSGDRGQKANDARMVVARDIGAIIGNGRPANSGTSGRRRNGTSEAPGTAGTGTDAGEAAPTASGPAGNRNSAADAETEARGPGGTVEPDGRERSGNAPSEIPDGGTVEPDDAAPGASGSDEGRETPASPTLRRPSQEPGAVVDRIFEQFGRELSVVADRETRRMRTALEKLGMPVPPEIRDGEWALSKMAERFLELEIRDVLRPETTAGDLFDANEKFVRLGSELLDAVRADRAVRTEAFGDADRAFAESKLANPDGWDSETLRDLGRRMDGLAG